MITVKLTISNKISTSWGSTVKRSSRIQLHQFDYDKNSTNLSCNHPSIKQDNHIILKLQNHQTMVTCPKFKLQ